MMPRPRPETYENYTLNFSIYCRGLIYQARPWQFIHGFDESNPYDPIYITRTAIFIVVPHDTAAMASISI